MRWSRHHRIFKLALLAFAVAACTPARSEQLGVSGRETIHASPPAASTLVAKEIEGLVVFGADATAGKVGVNVTADGSVTDVGSLGRLSRLVSRTYVVPAELNRRRRWTS
jgi:hypothetical protein